jgi:hypothetical protein
MNGGPDARPAISLSVSIRAGLLTTMIRRDHDSGHPFRSTPAPMRPRVFARSAFRFLRPPRPGFALPGTSSQAHFHGGGSRPHVAGHVGPSVGCSKYGCCMCLRGFLPRYITVFIGSLLVYCAERRGPRGREVTGGGGRRGALGGERYADPELGGCSASGTNGYGFPIPSRVSSGDGVPHGNVRSHWRVSSSGPVGLMSGEIHGNVGAGLGADGGRFTEEGELPWVDRYDAHARSRTAR